MIWTKSQKQSLAVLILVIVAILGIRLWQNSTTVQAPPAPAGTPQVVQLQDRIDPNTADEAALAALPSIGPALARRIVEYRGKALNETPDRLPFQTRDDLLHIEGIGESTLENLDPYLILPGAPDQN